MSDEKYINERFQEVLKLMEDVDEIDKYTNMEEIYHNAKEILNNILKKIKNICERDSIDSTLKGYIDRVELNVLRRLGIVYLELTQYDEALIAFEKVLYLHDVKRNDFADLKGDVNIDFLLNHTESNDEKRDLVTNLSLAWTHHDLAVIYTVMKKYSTAEEHFNKAISYVKDVRDTSTEAWFLNDLGWMYHEKGEYENARDQYNKVLNLKISDEKFKAYYKAYPYFYLGLAYYSEDRERCGDTIIENFLNSKSIMEYIKDDCRNDLDNKLFIANIDTNLGRLYLDENKLESAQKHLNSAINTYKDEKKIIMKKYTPRRIAVMNENISNAHNLLGKLYFEKGLTQEAIDEFKTAKNESKSKNIGAKYYNNMGCIHFKGGRLDKAVENFSLAIKTDPSLQGALDNLKLISKSTTRTAGFSDFWFGNDGKFNQDSIIKSLLACGFIFLIISNITIIMIPGTNTESSWGYVSETTIEKTQRNNEVSNVTTKTTNKVSPNFEYNLVLIGLSLLILMLPWVKSFEAMKIKMEFKENPAILTGGAGNSPALPKMEA